MKSKLSTHNCSSGFTLPELLVSSALGIVIGAVALSMFSGSRQMVRYDIDRTSLNQNVRSALDIIGMNIRIAGENLPGTFPAIEVVNGSGSDADELILRRSLLDDSLTVCQEIDAGTAFPIYFRDSASDEASCAFDASGDDARDAWAAHRISVGGTGLGYIYSRESEQGEWFTWGAEDESFSTRSLSSLGGSWTNSYSPAHSAAYVVEEWHFILTEDTLQMFEDNSDTAVNIVNGISDFQVNVELEDGSILNEIGPGDNWSNVKLIKINLSGFETSGHQTIERSIESSFFPRNVLSN